MKISSSNCQNIIKNILKIVSKNIIEKQIQLIWK